MSGSYTAGPWVARRMHTGGYDIFDPRNRDVVTVYGGGVEAESREANAHLIAAAPDLLEALKDAVEDLEATLRWRGEGWECTEDELLGKARAAILKATAQPTKGVENV